MKVPDELSPAQTKSRPLPEAAEYVIIGAGVIGLAIAYNLAKRGVSNIVVVERGYLAEGASGRNGGGIRQQWATESHVRLMQRSVALCRAFAKEVGVNIWFRQGGYLFLARTDEEVRRLQASVAIQNRASLPTRILEPSQIGDIVPEIDVRGVLAAAFNPSDGILFPWPFLWGYAKRAIEQGAELHTFCEVVGIERETAGFTVATSKGQIRARRVINAAGAWSPTLARMVGVELPTYPMRHEICSSEPLKPFLGPMVSELSSGLYFSQSMRGEIVGGVSHGHGSTMSMGSQLDFLRVYARRLTRVMPILGRIKVLRQWAGPYDVSPDGQPILGEPDGVPDFYLACGFVGHGFMMAPVIGELYADFLISGEQHEFFQRCRLSRFHDGSDLETEDFNIG